MSRRLILVRDLSRRISSAPHIMMTRTLSVSTLQKVLKGCSSTHHHTFRVPVNREHVTCHGHANVCAKGFHFTSRKEGPADKERPVASSDLIHHLERTSLVDFESSEALERLNEAIQFADQLFEVNTDGVEPLVTVLENETLHLREDVCERTERGLILKNASVTEEDYFVAPPGNIPLENESKDYTKKVAAQTPSST